MSGQPAQTKTIRSQLLADMKDGAYASCERLPRESILAEKLGISRTQLRDILASLEREGFITRRHGVGTIINRHVLNVQTRMDIEVEFLDMIRQSGHEPAVAFVRVSDGTADAQVAAQLRIPEDTPIIRIARLCTADGRPAIYCEDVVEKALAKGDYTIQDFKLPIFHFLQRFCGKSFPEAVEYLLDYHGWARDSPAPQKSVPSKGQDRQKDEPPPPFALPLPNTDQRRVFAYLQKRGIAPQVIRGFIQAGLLYEDAEHHNCVFVGRNRSGTSVFASKRGTYDRSGPGFKGDVTGSDKNTAFRLPCRPELNAVLVFEAPIDLMSYCTLHRQVTSNAVALCGLHEGALDTYLRENPQLRHIVLCLDADEPGQSAVERLRAKYEAAGYMVQSRTPPCGKDWNEYLQQRGPIRERGDLRQTVTR